MRKTEFLGPRETFEVYERRSNSPNSLNARALTPTHIMTPVREGTPAVFMAVEQPKRQVPLGLIVGVAVAVPVFVILMLFLAVWLQEMGII